MYSVAVNASILRAPRTGIGHYLAELVRALAAHSEFDLQLFNGWNWQSELPAAAMPGYSRLSSALKRIPGAYALRRVAEQRRFDRNASSIGLYHEPSLWPFEFDGPMVMTLHDLTHVHYPQTQPADRLAAIHRYSERGVAQAHRILVDSHFIAEEVRQHYGLAAERIVVAPLGHSARFRPREARDLAVGLTRLGLQPGGYLLCVGTLEPRKNLQLALRAHERLPGTLRRQYPLVLAGMPGWRAEQLEKPLQRALAGGQVRLLGYQDDLGLAELFAGARLLLFPSLYEGFGLPVLEAMASGTPVIASNRASIPEVLGEAGVLIDPMDDVACAAAIEMLIEDQGKWGALRAAGLLRAKTFTWQQCAHITAGAYREAVKS